jgi:serine/threonine protein kinase
VDTPDRHLITIFGDALDCVSPDEQVAYLDRVCCDNSELRGRVEALLQAHHKVQGMEGFLARPPATTGEERTAELQANAKSTAAEDTEDLYFLAPATRPDSFGRLANYEMLQVLGRGGFGIVFRAIDDVLQRVVAVKVMAPQMATLSPARKRFLREARSSAAVRHENVVQVYDIGEQPLPYIVMEFIPGESLQHKLDRSGPLELLEILRIGRQITEGLAAAHACEFIHRDIKPANILLEGGSGRVKITDFGLARAADDASLSQSGVIAGTPMYMAPEQALGQKIDQRADLFSLGSVLYQMTSGRPPFRATTTLGVLKRVAEETARPIPEIIPGTPDWLCSLIEKLHAKNPGERFQSAREVADLLAECEAKIKAKQEITSFLPDRKRHHLKQNRWRLASLAFLMFPLLSLTLTERTGVTHFFKQQKQQLTIAPTKPDAEPATPKRIDLPNSLKGHPARVTAVTFSPDGRFLASSGLNAIFVWNAETGDLIHQFPVAPKDDICALTFSPDSKWLLTAPVWQDSPGTISIWNLGNGLLDGTLEGHTSGVFEISFSPDGKLLASAGWDRMLHQWDFSARRQLSTIPVAMDNHIRSVVISKDNTIALACDAMVLLLQQDGTIIQKITKPGQTLRFSPDGQYLAWSDWRKGTVTIWHIERDEEIATWCAHDGYANGIAFSPNGNVLATTGGDGKVRIWDVKTHLLIAQFAHNGESYSVAFSPDGTTLASAGYEDKLVKLWDVSAFAAGSK